jgi:hypothetical protein
VAITATLLNGAVLADLFKADCRVALSAVTMADPTEPMVDMRDGFPMPPSR